MCQLRTMSSQAGTAQCLGNKLPSKCLRPQRQLDESVVADASMKCGVALPQWTGAGCPDSRIVVIVVNKRETSAQP